MNQYNRTREIINQLTNRNSTPNNQRYGTIGKNILVVFTGTDIGLEEDIKVLMTGKGYGFKYDLVFTQASEALLDVGKICQQLQPRRVFEETKDFYPEAIVSGIDCIIAPQPTQNTAFKLALGVQDQLVPRLLWEALWNNIPVWMDLDSLHLYKGLESKSSTLQQMVSGYVEKLVQMGVKKIENSNYLLEVLQGNSKVEIMTHKPMEVQIKAEEKGNSQRVILTEKDILSYPVEQKEIHVSHKSIITSLAQDAAKARGIKIVKINTPN